jgi:hypothetical protein
VDVASQLGDKDVRAWLYISFHAGFNGSGTAHARFHPELACLLL